MSLISRDELLALASLSRLRLSKDEIERLPAELSAILEFVKQLDEVDAKGLQPTYQVSGLKSVMRRDEVKEYQAKPTDIMKIAPTVQDGQFKVKRVI